MRQQTKNLFCGLLVAVFSVGTPAFSGDAIDDFYKAHKNDQDMEARKIPPKAASLMVDDEYVDAIDILQSMYSLKYLNYYGDKKKIGTYFDNAIKHKEGFEQLFTDTDYYRTVTVFGIRKKNKVKKVMAVMKAQNQFLLVIGKGNLTEAQVAKFPELSKEIQ